jgi:AGCS family alanine or glycine:cation symporter
MHAVRRGFTIRPRRTAPPPFSRKKTNAAKMRKCEAAQNQAPFFSSRGPAMPRISAVDRRVARPYCFVWPTLSLPDECEGPKKLMLQFVQELNNYLGGPALACLCLGVGLYLSIRTRFVQLRRVKDMIALIFDGRGSDAGVSSFQALAMTLAGRVGTGNIAGVATALSLGGPGALFWMWIVAFLGASSAFVESTLGQVYKEKLAQEYRGGPAFYIEKGLQMPRYAWLFAIVTVFSVGVLLTGVQANAIGESMHVALGIDTSITAGFLSVVLGIIIFGGVKRIANFASLVVPFMAVGYILVACLIVGMNIEKLPDVISLILRSAFASDAAFGAVAGQAIIMGVKRGLFSNEAGQGTGPHASSAAVVTHPAKQGLVQAFSVYVDTLFVCTATGFMLLSTGLYNVQGEHGEALYTGLAGVDAGPGYVQAAIESVIPGFGASLVALVLFFFATTTILAYYYIAETNLAYINRKLNRPWLGLVLRLSMMGTVFYGTVKTAELAWALGDLGVSMMAWLNIVAIMLLQKPALACLRDYETQKKHGVDPVFHPDRLGIKNADYWSSHRAEDNHDLAVQPLHPHGGPYEKDEVTL